MVIREGLFDVFVFGLLFASPFIDRWLASCHRYLTGAFTASAWALFAYLSMWEICRRSPLLRRHRSLESIATALAAGAVGIVFVIQRNNHPLAMLIVSIGLMMGALMASIAIVGTFLDWKLTTLEWVFTACWVGGGGGFLAKGVFWDKTTAQEAALIHGGTLVAVLLLALLVKRPTRALPTLALLGTIALSLLWGCMASNAVLLGTKASVSWETAAVAIAGALAWVVIHAAVPTDASLPVDVPDTRPSTVWAGPVGLIIYRVFETTTLPNPQPAQVERDSEVAQLVHDESTAAAAVGTEPSGTQLTLADPVVVGLGVAADIVSPLPVPMAPMPQFAANAHEAPPSAVIPASNNPKQPWLCLIFPGRLAERIAVPAAVATALYQFIQ